MGRTRLGIFDGRFTRRLIVTHERMWTMQNGTAELSTPPRKSDGLNTPRESLAPARSKSHLRKIPMDMRETTSVSETPNQQPNSANGQSRAVMQHEDSYQATYEAGLASARESAYRRGYQEGFFDGCKVGISAGGAPSRSATTAGEARKAADHRSIRLRGLPCVNCRCSMYSDEEECRCCGTPKATALEKSTEPS